MPLNIFVYVKYNNKIKIIIIFCIHNRGSIVQWLRHQSYELVIAVRFRVLPIIFFMNMNY